MRKETVVSAGVGAKMKDKKQSKRKKEQNSNKKIAISLISSFDVFQTMQAPKKKIAVLSG